MKRTILILNHETPLYLSILFLMIYEFLPIIHVINPLLLSTGRMLATLLFLLYVFQTKASLSARYIGILIIALLISFLAYYHCWCNYETIGSFMIKNLMCWVYMEIGVFINRYGSDRIKASIGNMFLILGAVSSITSMIVLHSVPTAVRELANGSMNIKGSEVTLYFRNTLTWGGLYGLTFLLPYLICKYKKSRNRAYLLIVALFEVCILRSQITAAIIISVVFLAFIIIEPTSLRKMLLISAPILIALLLMPEIIENLLRWLMNFVGNSNNSVLALRLFQIYRLYTERVMVGTIRGRFNLYSSSLTTFINNPIIGFKLRNVPMFSYIGLHSQIFDLLASVGLLGFAPLAVFFGKLSSGLLRDSSNLSSYNYVLLTMAVFVALMVLNPTWYAESIYLSVFLGASICSERSEQEQEQEILCV